MTDWGREDPDLERPVLEQADVLGLDILEVDEDEVGARFHWGDLSSEITNLRGLSRRSGGMTEWSRTKLHLKNWIAWNVLTDFTLVLVGAIFLVKHHRYVVTARV